MREDWGSGTAGDRSVRTMEGQLTGFPTDADPEPEEKWGNEQICLVPHPSAAFSNRVLWHLQPAGLLRFTSSLKCWYREFLSFSILIRMLNGRLAEFSMKDLN